MLALLLLGCILLNVACAEDPFADKSQTPAFVGRDNSFTDPNATPVPGTER